MRSKVLMTGFLALAMSTGAMAAKVTYTGKVENIRMEDNALGQCAIVMVPSVDSQISGCNRWASLDCQGKYTSKDKAMRKLSTAQLGFVTRRNVRITVDNSAATKHGTACLVTAIWNLR